MLNLAETRKSDFVIAGGTGANVLSLKGDYSEYKAKLPPACWCW